MAGCNSESASTSSFADHYPLNIRRAAMDVIATHTPRIAEGIGSV